MYGDKICPHMGLCRKLVKFVTEIRFYGVTDERIKGEIQPIIKRNINVQRFLEGENMKLFLKE